MEPKENEISYLVLGMIHQMNHQKIQVSCDNFKVNALSKGEISEKQFFMLFMVGCLEINTVSRIAKHLRQSTGSVSITISKLNNAGYLNKGKPQGDGADKRQMIYAITPEGQTLLMGILENVLEEVQKPIKALSPENKLHFLTGYHMLKAVAKNTENSFVIENPPKDFFRENFKLDENGEIAAMILTDAIIFVGWIKKYYDKILNGSVYKRLTPGKIRALSAMNYRGCDTIKDISGELMSSESAVCIMLSNLQRDGYVEKIPPGRLEDQRTIRYIPTKNGEKALSHIMEGLIHTLDKFYASLDGEAKKMVYDGILLLNEAFE